ncbi:serine hydrolase [Sphingomonas sp.]|jgi:beta-lactamase class A|uniref:serine hydrolase n=1 Tax=Sphingomonas sp. TaxID=28214 RepID=UPI002E32122F|nr:serine hydrolase [Sphingomonas sp.]HEX4695138.1 serine hydrolase [Sphingomonas sp.]
MSYSVKRIQIVLGAVAGLAIAGCASDSMSSRVARAAPPPPVVFAAPAPVVRPLPPRRVAPPEALVALVQTLTRDFGGKVGVAVRSIDDDWTVTSNGDLKLPQQSVSKLWVAMTVLDARDQGKLTLDDPITVRKEDLTLFHQPIAALVKDEGYQTTIGGLLQRALTQSDNTANDRLLQYVGGPNAVRAFLAKKAIADIRFGPGERALQSLTAGLQWKPEYSRGNAFEQARARIPASTRMDAFESYIANPPDGAAPRAIATALARLKRGELLSPDSTQYLIGTMESSRTGRQRMRGAVPPGWTFGHKTGTGQNFGSRTAGYNDVGFLVAPDGKAYAIAVMIGDTDKTIPQRQELMQAVVLGVVTNYRG